MTPPPAPRIVSLDVIRGVAVMGILIANLPAFALPEAAYFSPVAWGGSSPADVATWFATFVLVEGKMRGLFTFLFGASMLVVIDAARARGDGPARVHFARMATLFAIGCLHLYLFWWGDILTHYALVGALAFMATRLRVRWLIRLAVLLIAVQTIQSLMGEMMLIASAARDTPAHVAQWNAMATAFGRPPTADMLREIAATRGDFLTGVGWRWAQATDPLTLLPILLAETLAAMLLGMAGYRSGFLTGGWPRARYRRWAIVCLGLTLPIYVALAMLTMTHGFDMRWVFFASIVASEPIRPIMVVGYAALLMLAIRPAGALTQRIAAVGRAAFTNYLGTTLIMTFIFSGWGLGQFARWSRADLYWLAPATWAIMLLWSPWWLARYRYGPFEWLWRTIARLEVQPMRRAPLS